MNFNYKILTIALPLGALMLSSCDDGDKIIDEITDTTTRGAVLRTIETNGVLDRFDTSTTFDFTFEEQDPEGGDLLETVDLFLGFDDNTEGNGTTERDELLLRTYMPGDFTDGPFGLPRASYSTTLADALTALDIEEGEFDGGDAIEFRLVLNLTDGRSFTNSDNTGTITGAFFSAPFFYGPIIACIPPEPIPGEYELDMVDSFGDGWNGAAISVNIDGTVTEYTVTEDEATSASDTFTVPPGTTTFTLDFISGDFDSEVTFEITAPTGELAIEAGPSPAPGPITLNICGSVE